MGLQRVGHDWASITKRVSCSWLDSLLWCSTISSAVLDPWAIAIPYTETESDHGVILRKITTFWFSLSSKEHYDIWISILLWFRNGNQSALRKYSAADVPWEALLYSSENAVLEMFRFMKKPSDICPFSMRILSSNSYWHYAISFGFLWGLSLILDIREPNNFLNPTF